MKKKLKVKPLESKLDREKLLADYSFSLAVLFVPLLEWIRSFLIGSDPEEQLFFDDFIIIAYVVIAVPILIRAIAIFYQWIDPKNIRVFLSKRQIKTFESYKVVSGELDSNPEIREQSQQTLYLFAMNNIMWFLYVLIGVFVFTTVILNLVFSISITLFNVIPSLVLLIYKVLRIIFEKKRPK